MSALTSPRALARRIARAKKRAEKRRPKRKRPAVIRTRVERAAAVLKRDPSSKHALRELLCAENDTPNVGRQWKRLRKRLAREDRANAPAKRKRAA